MRRTPGSIGGVMDVEMRRALEEQRRKSSVDAAALQLDLARRLKLPGTSNGAIVRRQQQRPTAQHKEESRAPAASSKQQQQQQQQKESVPDIECASCCELNRGSDCVCRSCGYFLSGAWQPSPTLAQRRGLLQAPAKISTVSPEAWATIERRVDDRKDAFCPICMDAFKTGHEVLLSCSHMFHRHCLHAFEQFMGKEAQSCPICRTTNYQKKITQRGSKAFEIICASRLQAVWRGALARTRFRGRLRTLYSSSRHAKGHRSVQRRRFYERELSLYADRMSREVDVRSGIVDSVLTTMDATLQESRDLDALFDSVMRARLKAQRGRGDFLPTSEDEEDDLAAALAASASSTLSSVAAAQADDDEAAARSLSEAEWAASASKAKARGHGECAVCITSTASATRGIVLLSCSHLYHLQCLLNLEKFATAEVRAVHFPSTAPWRNTLHNFHSSHSLSHSLSLSLLILFLLSSFSFVAAISVLLRVPPALCQAPSHIVLRAARLSPVVSSLT